MKITALAFIDAGDSAAASLAANGFKIEVDDAVNGILSAEAEANDVLEALGLCERFREADTVGIIIYKGEDYTSEEFFEMDFSDAELGLV
jgi:hypothetical protein